MADQKTNNVKLGVFVLTGTAFLIIALYLIGNKKELFNQTITVSTSFRDVNGLIVGNNVRFAGIDVGSVSSIDIINDTTLKVSMIIEKKAQQFIHKNALAKIGTEGLMGNKLVNITPSEATAPEIEEGDEIASVGPIDADAVMRTLNQSNQNIEAITGDLRQFTKNISSRNSLWGLLMDSAASENVRQAIVNVKLTGNRTAIVSGDLEGIVRSVKEGKGSLGAILTDTIISRKMEQTIVEIKLISDNMASITGDLGKITQHINNGQGSVGTLLMDTAFVHNLTKSMENIKSGSNDFDENMKALKHTFFLRNYFRRKTNKDTTR